MPDLCHRNPAVYTGLLEYTEWLLSTVGFNGFRYDFVKGYGAWMARAIQELRGLKANQGYKPYGVGEDWQGGEGAIDAWLDAVNSDSDNPISAFDFPLRYRLKALCDTYGYRVSDLATGGTLMQDRPAQAVTFVENHDIARSNPIVNDKMLAYAVILTHEGYPCVFWQDYYTYGLARAGAPTGIATLVRLHEDDASGGTTVLHADDDLYIMQRGGGDGGRGLVFVLNNRGDWNGAWVQTQWQNVAMTPLAWSESAGATGPIAKQTQADGWADFWAPARGYAVYVPAR
jgi:alpha-amylase